MYLELKSFFKNKIIKIVLLISLLMSFLTVYNIFIYGPDQSKSYEIFREGGIYLKKTYEEVKLRIERDTPLEYKYLGEEKIKSLDWEIREYERLCDLFLDGYRKNEREIVKLSTYFKLYYMQQNTDYYGGYKYATEIFKDDIEKYLNIEEDLPFDLYSFENLHNVNWGQIKEKDKLDRHMSYTEDKKDLERNFYLLKNNLREVDIDSTSPWNYLAYTYSFTKNKPELFLPLVIIISTYIIILSKNEKSLELVKLKPMEKSKIYFYYLKACLLLALIIILVPDILSILFMGVKSGFYGLRNPIGIYKEGISSFKTYKHGSEVFYRGLGKIYGAGVYKNGNAYEFLGMENIEFYKFLILSLIPSILKIIFFVTLGISIGLLIKNKTLALITSTSVTLFTIFSTHSDYLRKSFNVFAIDSGWNVTLGHTEFSWFGSAFVLSISILLIIFFSLFILRKKDLE